MHIPVDEKNSTIQAISTHIGAFRVSRLAQGMKTTPSIFHSIMDQILGNLTGITTYFDNIVVWPTRMLQSSHHLPEFCRKTMCISTDRNANFSPRKLHIWDM